ncbi:helix-turn-helix transcriptional regulator [Nocardiopsis sp. CNT-189]
MREAVGALLRRVRLEQGRTLREVADDAQVSLPYLSEVERGRKEPSSEVLAAIRRALGLRLIDLIGGLHFDLASAEAMPARRPVGGPAFGGPRALLLAA